MIITCNPPIANKTINKYINELRKKNINNNPADATNMNAYAPRSFTYAISIIIIIIHVCRNSAAAIDRFIMNGRVIPSSDGGGGAGK
jgi:hypothetical protein